MQTFIWSDLSDSEKTQVLKRPAGLSDAGLMKQVREIMDGVKNEGDAAVKNYTLKFDGVDIDDLSVSKNDMREAWNALAPDQKHALKVAKTNIEVFHRAQKPSVISVETMPGVLCKRLPRAIETAGLYVPGGTAPLVSTLLMLAIPAKVAGVTRRVIVTPPGKDGRINSAILAAAHLCDVSDVFICGGAQAIAALAYGTETIPACDKIFGPGNAYVAAAKSIAAQEPGGPAIDLPAGPSEAMVVADQNANAAFVASDLLSQAEHDVLAQVICVCDSPETAAKITEEIDSQLKNLPRSEIATKSMTSSKVLIADSNDDILSIINRYAPEHLIIQTDRPDNFVPGIQNAGSIFLGPWTPESVGDYASGTNHTLPTYGAARSHSGVTLESFMKYISVQQLTREGLNALGPVVETLAEMEGLEAHKRAVSIRLESNSK